VKSIGDFAENLILNQTQNIQEGKELPPNLADAQAKSGAPAGRDISQVDVPDDFMKQVLGEGFHPQETPPAETMPEVVWTDSETEAEEAQPAPQTLTEETAQQLVPLLEEVRNMLKEMMTTGTTTTGQIGVNMAGPQSDPLADEERKNGYVRLSSSKPKRKPTSKQKLADRLINRRR
jgi:hypothetical protein